MSRRRWGRRSGLSIIASPFTARRHRSWDAICQDGETVENVCLVVCLVTMTLIYDLSLTLTSTEHGRPLSRTAIKMITFTSDGGSARIPRFPHLSPTTISVIFSHNLRTHRLFATRRHAAQISWICVLIVTNLSYVMLNYTWCQMCMSLDMRIVWKCNRGDFFVSSITNITLKCCV